jgi:hypothetical protein
LPRIVSNFLTAAAALLLFALALEGVLRLADYPGSPYTRPDLEAGARLVAGAHYKLRKEIGAEGCISSKGLRDYESPTRSSRAPIASWSWAIPTPRPCRWILRRAL